MNIPIRIHLNYSLFHKISMTGSRKFHTNYVSRKITAIVEAQKSFKLSQFGNFFFKLSKSYCHEVCIFCKKRQKTWITTKKKGSKFINWTKTIHFLELVDPPFWASLFVLPGRKIRKRKIENRKSTY